MKAKPNYRWVKEPIPWRSPSFADKVCVLANGDIEMALDMWRISHISLAKKCVEVIPHSQAAKAVHVAGSTRRDPAVQPTPRSRAWRSTRSI